MTLSAAASNLIWEMRIKKDERHMRDVIPRELYALHELLTIRARASGAEALMLTGSTARGTRTPISDLDYHLIGPPISKDDLSHELDLHVVSPDQLRIRLRNGDDFTQWSLRFACVVFDTGIIRESIQLIAEQQLWPDPQLKRDQARRSLKIARAMVASGDLDAAVEQVRTALTLTARWCLLENREFPLSRAELPGQLRDLKYSELADGLASTIHRQPQLDALARYVDTAEALVDKPFAATGAHGHSRAA